MENPGLSFARISKRPNISNLYPKIFLDRGPLPTQMIEIEDTCILGKVNFFLDVIARLVLPVSYKNIRLPGKDSRVLLVSTEHGISSQSLRTYLETALQIYIPIERDIKKLVELCLPRLIIMKANTPNDMRKVIKDLTNIVGRNDNIGVVIVDSISSYYWAERATFNFSCIQEYNTAMLGYLKSCLDNIEVATFYGINKGSASYDGAEANDPQYLVKISEMAEQTYELKAIGPNFQTTVLFTKTTLFGNC